MSDEPKKPLRGKCGHCAHVWTVAYLPMRLDKAAALMAAARCPNCAGETIFVAQEGDS